VALGLKLTMVPLCCQAQWTGDRAHKNSQTILQHFHKVEWLLFSGELGSAGFCSFYAKYYAQELNDRRERASLPVQLLHMQDGNSLGIG